MSIDTPGALVGDGELIVHTRQAQSLYNGRARKGEKNGIISLPQYSRFCQRLITHSNQGDLYAQWYLARLNEMIQLFKLLLRGQRALLSEKVHHPALKINTWVSRSPLKMSFNGIQNEYGFVGLYLILEIDLVIRQAVTAKKSCNMSYGEFKTLINTVSKQSRQIFHLPTAFINKALIRDDPDDEKLQQAIKLMGALPKELLEVDSGKTQDTIDELGAIVVNRRRRQSAFQKQGA